jgi:ATP-binding cassette, subfamily B, bacterial HlyB/CyaB
VLIQQSHFLWAIDAVCAALGLPVHHDQIGRQFVGDQSLPALLAALGAVGATASRRKVNGKLLHKEPLPLIIWLLNEGLPQPALILAVNDDAAIFIRPTSTEPETLSLKALQSQWVGEAISAVKTAPPEIDPDSNALAQQAKQFGFSWFIPELLKHKTIWRDILFASLVIQLLALATPLFTQIIIDKVVVHRTQSTLFVVLFGMSVFVIFSSVLSWLRQYLVLHTGNRVDAVLGSAVFERLLKLPPQYFQMRPTGVISARLHGIETIREFIASTAVTLVLDLPFLLVFVAVMFYYSLTLSAIVLSVIFVIALMSALIAPMFQKRLQEQFQLGARNRAFVTEYVAGIETVKSLQFEPSLNSRYRQYFASYLRANMATKLLGNTYNSFAQGLEQIMTIAVLGVGAWMVMSGTQFTIGMLVAFQMFASRVSQPLLRLVGLWQQFQQARLSVDRLGDLMNAPMEPYSIAPKRPEGGSGQIKFEGLSFRYSDKLPWLYKNLNSTFVAGQSIAIMGPSGSGKSTLARLLQGFHQPNEGRITVDGVDIAFLSANELRANFGVVPQETTLFSGSIMDNLQLANANASFEDIVNACRLAEIYADIEKLPEGYQTHIGERGSSLSGGQRQRIAIARALLKKPKILVFDEATSALDAATAEQFAKTVNSLRGKVTMLFITHGLPRALQIDALFQLTPTGLNPVALAKPPAPAVETLAVQHE